MYILLCLACFLFKTKKETDISMFCQICCTNKFPQGLAASRMPGGCWRNRVSKQSWNIWHLQCIVLVEQTGCSGSQTGVLLFGSQISAVDVAFRR